jgi:CheY-like chemotaxis protein
LNLPKNDGIEMLRAIRQSERFAQIPVVVTSSLPSLPLQARREQLPITRNIHKPPVPGDFLKIGTVLKEVILKSSAGPFVPPQP